MPCSCCAYGCKEKAVKGSTVTFHSFPKDKDRRRLWEIKIRRENFKATNSSKICSKHFAPDCFETERFGGTWLKKTAVPTLFEYNNYQIQKGIGYVPIIKEKPKVVNVVISEQKKNSKLDSGNKHSEIFESCPISNPEGQKLVMGPADSTFHSEDIISTNSNLILLRPMDTTLRENNSNLNSDDEHSEISESCQILNPEGKKLVMAPADSTFHSEDIISTNSNVILLSPVDTTLRSDEQLESRLQSFPQSVPSVSTCRKVSAPTLITIGPRKRVCYVGDFSEEDMDCPEKARELLAVARKQIRSFKLKLKMLSQRNRRLEKKVISLKKMLVDLSQL